MTIKEFARKYDIPYHIAYKASYRVHPTSSFTRDLDFSEEDLQTETQKYAQRRYRDCQRHLELYADIIEKVQNPKKLGDE